MANYKIEIDETFDVPRNRVFALFADHERFGKLLGAPVKRIRDSDQADPNGLGSIRKIGIGSPIRLIHGLKDEDVPWETSRTISERVRTRDVEVTFVKEGDHRLSEPHDLIRLKRTLTGLLEALGGD